MGFSSYIKSDCQKVMIISTISALTMATVKSTSYKCSNSFYSNSIAIIHKQLFGSLSTSICYQRVLIIKDNKEAGAKPS